MNIVRLYADLQLNPNSHATYKEIAKYYKNIGENHISTSFEKLIEKKFNDCTHIDEKQRKNNSKND